MYDRIVGKTCRDSAPRPFVCLLVVAAICVSTPAVGAPSSKLVLRDGPRILDALPVELYAPRFPSGGDAAETWTYTMQFAGGYAISAQFQATNLGPGDGTGLVLAWYVTPDGEVTVTKNSRKREDWVVERSLNGVSLKLADHVWRLGHSRQELHLRHSQGQVDLEIAVLTPALRVGRIDYGNGAYHETTILAPRLSASGELRLPNRKPVKLTGGRGILVHTLSNLADRKRAIASLQLDTFDQPTQLTLIELTAPEDRGLQRVGLLMVVRDDKIQHFSTEFTRAYEEYRRDPQEPNYQVPRGARLTAVDQGRSVRGRVNFEDGHRDDLLEFVNSGVARWFAKRKVKARPVLYRLGARYEFEVDLGDGLATVSGRGIGSLAIINDPPVEF